MTLGDKESKDQVETAIYLGTLPYVDKDRIAIWGWSFGGFNTLMSMCDGRPVFRCGVAVAPVTDWRFYDSAYTERYMRTPNENPGGYNVSPLHRCANLSGDILLCHGYADDNVHFQNMAELTERLVQENIQFESQFYVNRNHSIYGGNTRRHLFTRIENFLDARLLK
jgi:dipeptidyl-peptidase-4